MSDKQNQRAFRKSWILAGVLSALLIAVAARSYAISTGKVKIESTFQAVLLDNGSAYFGRLEGLGTAFPVLHDVYYVQTGTNPETKQPTHVLVKRGKEWHSPDRMVLNAPHILFVEPVASNSTVADLIRQSEQH